MNRNEMNRRVRKAAIRRTVICAAIAAALAIAVIAAAMLSGGWRGGKDASATQQPTAAVGVSAGGECQITMQSVMNGVQLQDNGEYTVRSGDTVTVTAMSEVAGIERIGYYFYENDEKLGEISDDYDGALTITLPERESGAVLYLFVEAIAENDDGTPNTVTKTGWMQYKLVYA